MANVATDCILERIRKILKDDPTDSGNRRWGNTELCYWITEGVREMIDKRSDMYCVADAEYTGTSIPAIADIGEAGDVNIHSSNLHILIDYVLARAFAKDAEDGDMNLANAYMQSFYAKLGVKP